jgi:predicted outer membrane protein
VNTRTLLGVAAAALLALGLTACAPAAEPTDTPSSVIAPVTMDAGDLQGAKVELKVGQVLNINTGDLAVDSYTATISDEKVAEFVQGREDGSATFNPGITALAEGSTEVEMRNAQGGIQPLEFTVEVTQR